MTGHNPHQPRRLDGKWANVPTRDEAPEMDLGLSADRDGFDETPWYTEDHHRGQDGRDTAFYGGGLDVSADEVAEAREALARMRARLAAGQAGQDATPPTTERASDYDVHSDTPWYASQHDRGESPYSGYSAP